jgi:hypothetical protein
VYVGAGRAAVEVRLRRFADAFPEAPALTVNPRTTTVVRMAADHSPKPWVVQLRSAAPFRFCTL